MAGSIIIKAIYIGSKNSKSNGSGQRIAFKQNSLPGKQGF